MSISAGSHELGPRNGKLSIRTRKAGAASKAGHNLLIEVTAWSATLEVGAAGASIALSADARSLRVLDGTGGVTALSPGDKAGIKQTIDEQVLRGEPIEFRSTSVRVQTDGDGVTQLQVDGELQLGRRRGPIAFALSAGAGGRLVGAATVKQSSWGIKPYSAMFGTLKVVDEVSVEIDAALSDGATD